MTMNDGGTSWGRTISFLEIGEMMVDKLPGAAVLSSPLLSSPLLSFHSIRPGEQDQDRWKR